MTRAAALECVAFAVASRAADSTLECRATLERVPLGRDRAGARRFSAQSREGRRETQRKNDVQKVFASLDVLCVSFRLAAEFHPCPIFSRLFACLADNQK